MDVNKFSDFLVKQKANETQQREHIISFYTTELILNANVGLSQAAKSVIEFCIRNIEKKSFTLDEIQDGFFTGLTGDLPRSVVKKGVDELQTLGYLKITFVNGENRLVFHANPDESEADRIVRLEAVRNGKKAKKAAEKKANANTFDMFETELQEAVSEQVNTEVQPVEEIQLPAVVEPVKEVKKPKAKKKSSMTEEAKAKRLEMARYFYASYEAKYGFKALNTQKNNGVLAHVYSQCGFDLGIEVIDRYLASKDAFLVKNRHAPALLATQLERIIGDIHAGFTITNKDARQMEESFERDPLSGVILVNGQEISVKEFVHVYEEHVKRDAEGWIKRLISVKDNPEKLVEVFKQYLVVHAGKPWAAVYPGFKSQNPASVFRNEAKQAKMEFDAWCKANVIYSENVEVSDPMVETTLEIEQNNTVEVDGETVEVLDEEQPKRPEFFGVEIPEPNPAIDVTKWFKARPPADVVELHQVYKMPIDFDYTLFTGFVKTSSISPDGIPLTPSGKPMPVDNILPDKYKWAILKELGY